MKRFSFLMLMFALLGFVACEQDKPLPDAQDGLVLSADVESITADGMSVANFTVKLNNEVVTSDCYIYNVESGEPLSGSFFTSTTEGRYSFYATRGSMKSNTVVIDVLAAGETPAEKVAVLSVSKSEIISNGTDAAIFVVSVDNEDVTNDAKIYLESSNQPLEGNSFTTTEEGTYKFFAEVEGAKRSQSVTVVATAEPVVEEKPIELSASVDTIRANGVDAVAFTVKQEGNIVTDACTIYVDGAKLNGSRFSTYAAGTYTFYAVKGSVTSNEVVVTAEEVTDTGKTVLFAEGVSITSGWYDVNKKDKGNNGDINMCWAATASNMIQWWQDRYVAAGNELPAGAVTGPGVTSYTNYGPYELELMSMFHSEWNNERGCQVVEAIPWYFEGVNYGQTASEGSQAYPLTEGGYWKDVWSDIYPNLYHEYNYMFNWYKNLYTGSFLAWTGWDESCSESAPLSGTDAYVAFSRRVIEFLERGVSELTISTNPNGGTSHATTLWGCEYDNATGLVTRIWITDSDDLEYGPKQSLLNEYAVSALDGNYRVALKGNTRYGEAYATELQPLSGYGSGDANN